MQRLTYSVAANAVGKGLATGLALLLTPAYVRLLGVEAFGLLGFLTSLQALFTLLDVGLSTTVNREVSRFSAIPNSAFEQRTLVRTIEWIYWGIATLVLMGVSVASPWIAQRWFVAESLSQTELRHAFILMGLIILFQFPFYLYQGVLLGLECQVTLNGIIGVYSIIRFVGALAAIRYISPTVTTFLLWNAGAVALQTIAAAVYAWRRLPRSAGSIRFDLGVLKRTCRFGFGVSLITVSGAALWQFDKVILCSYVALDELGYYSLASFIASSLVVMSYTLFNAIFPRFSYLVAAKQEATLAALYPAASQGMALLVVPLGTTFTVLSFDLCWAWTGSAELAGRMWPFVSLLTPCVVLNSLYCIPMALQFAYGWTRVTVGGLVVGLITVPLAMILLAPHHGAIGVAFTLLSFYSVYIPACSWLVHRRLLPQLWRSWSTFAFGLPLLIGFSMAIVSGLLRPTDLGRFGLMLWLFGTCLSTLFVLALALPIPRHWLQKGTRRLGEIRPLRVADAGVISSLAWSRSDSCHGLNETFSRDLPPQAQRNLPILPTGPPDPLLTNSNPY